MRVPNRVNTKDAFSVSTPSTNPRPPQGGDGTFVVPETPNPGTGGSTVPVVYFYDRSTGNPTSWSWQFYDSNDVLVTTSSVQNPVITFPRAGTYSAILTTEHGTTGKIIVVR